MSTGEWWVGTAGFGCLKWAEGCAWKACQAVGHGVSMGWGGGRLSNFFWKVDQENLTRKLTTACSVLPHIEREAESTPA